MIDTDMPTPAVEEKLEATLVGVVNKTLRFRTLADFQIEMPQDDDISKLVSYMVDLDGIYCRLKSLI